MEDGNTYTPQIDNVDRVYVTAQMIDLAAGVLSEVSNIIKPHEGAKGALLALGMLGQSVPLAGPAFIMFQWLGERYMDADDNKIESRTLMIQINQTAGLIDKWTE